MELIWLEDFLALADRLSFSNAAKARNVTQPAFSRRIRSLEMWIGTALFERTTHYVSLTPAGEYFRTEAANLVRNLHQLRRATRDVGARNVSRLSFAATHALSFTFFPRWIRSDEMRFPTENVNLSTGTMEACEQMMLHGDAQFLLCHYHPGSANRLERTAFIGVPIGRDILLPLCAPTPSGQPNSILGGEMGARYLAYSDRSGLGRIVADRVMQHPAAARLEKVFSSDLATTLMSMACDGGGVAWLPKTLAEDQIAAGKLVRAGGDELSIPVEIRLFRPVARLSPTAEAVWSKLKRADNGSENRMQPAPMN